ncbi:MAG: FAD-dependent oxidoreductase [Alphaproteobacteria bacterium]|nr:FAD-dependent oxidoreductase [Alphaproteobacteria bacterium]
MALMRVAVIGAGLTGLTCASRLMRAGMDVRVFDKGRGLGGRLASRRLENGLRFDHGATYVETDDPAFLRTLEFVCARGAGTKTVWASGEAKYVGLPGMSSLVRPLAEGLPVTRRAQVTAIEWVQGEWRIFFESDTVQEQVDLVILTVPAPQAAQLAAAYPSLTSALDAVDFDPCWALMAAFDGATAHAGGDAALPESLTKLSVESDKPGRSSGASCLVAHASPEWSRAHLEEDLQTVADLLLSEVRRACTGASATPSYLSAHRWRYARTSTSLARPYLTSPDGRLFVGGDWCLGNSAEHAHASGTAMANAVLEAFSLRRRAS